MERRPLLVSEERVGNPDLFPAPLAHSDLVGFASVERVEPEPGVFPGLSQVHADRVVLRLAGTEAENTRG